MIVVTRADPVVRLHGWTMARRNALLRVGWTSGQPVTIEAARALGQQLNTWARDPNLYAVLIEPSVACLTMGDLAPDAGPEAAELVWRLACFSKPTVSLQDTTAGDYGWALALAGTHQVAGARFHYQITALQTRRLPPGNMVAIIARGPKDVAADLLLGRRAIGARAALAIGLATHTIPAEGFAAIEAGLADAEPVDPLLDDSVALAVPDRHDETTAPVVEAAMTDIGQAALAEVRVATDDVAISLCARYNEALRRTPEAASRAEIEATLAGIELPLPSRRILQAFRQS